jgi:hypothetical protein
VNEDGGHGASAFAHPTLVATNRPGMTVVLGLTKKQNNLPRPVQWRKAAL